MSFKAGAAVVSAVLNDVKTKVPVIDKTKLHREQKKMKESIMKWT